jgi:hypothetical protein
VLVTYGLYDTTEIAMREIKSRLEEPEYWGDSISFYPMAPAQIIRANGATIPVYTDGVLEEISTLPEQDAASWMTATPNIVEVKRMLNQRQMNAFVKLFGDEEEARKWLEENAATRNRTIIDEGMITRARRELEEIAKSPNQHVETPETTPTATDGETMISQIVEQVVARMNIPDAVASAVQPLTDSLTSVVSRMDALEQRLQTADTQSKTIAQTLTRLDKSEAQKKRDWLNDLPVKPTTEPTYRPREQRAADREKTGDEAAKEVLDRIPTY